MKSSDNKSKPDYAGHRKRIKNRFLNMGLESFSDYEALELILTYAVRQKDIKPAAKRLIKAFKNFPGVLETPVDDLKKIDGIGEHSALLLKLIRECSDYYLREKIHKKDVVSSPADLYRYCRSSMAHLGDEHFRVIYLNSKNEVLHAEVIQQGTVDQTAVYPRKIIEGAINKKAVSLIVVHNHPSGNPAPSEHDKTLTASLLKAVTPLSIKLHDHVIIAKNGYFSFKEQGLL